MKKALITGITGQDGSYLAEFLLKRDYEVYGITRKPIENYLGLWPELVEVKNRLKVYETDVSETREIENIFRLILPDEVYHLASVVEPRVIFEEEEKIFNINFFGALNLLKAVKKHKSDAKIFLAGSSLMFGDTSISPQNETTPLKPSTPYGIAKAAAFELGVMYRRTHRIFVSNGILFNHESPRRRDFFLPRKITSSVAKIKLGIEKELRLGDISTKRDWGFAGDFVEAMWLMLQSDKPDDFVVASGKSHSVQDILEIAFGYAGLNWKKYVVLDKKLRRDVEYSNLRGNISKIKKELNWHPHVSFRNLIETMTNYDIKLYSK